MDEKPETSIRSGEMEDTFAAGEPMISFKASGMSASPFEPEQTLIAHSARLEAAFVAGQDETVY